jgi:hypothetical protein
MFWMLNFKVCHLKTVSVQETEFSVDAVVNLQQLVWTRPVVLNSWKLENLKVSSWDSIKHGPVENHWTRPTIISKKQKLYSQTLKLLNIKFKSLSVEIENRLWWTEKKIRIRFEMKKVVNRSQFHKPTSVRQITTVLYFYQENFD